MSERFGKYEIIVRVCFFLVFSMVCGCSPMVEPVIDGKYGSGDLAKKWRTYQYNSYPMDNDAQYYYPSYGRVPLSPPPPVVSTPAPYYVPQGGAYYPGGYMEPLDYEDNYYGGRYPTYDSSADSTTANYPPTQSNDDEFNYPLFFDD